MMWCGNPAGADPPGMDGAASEALDLFVRYQGLFSANHVENAFSAGLAVSF